ncbi:MAG TPA: cytochrome c [Polyangiaceae bacterium]|nr:cytochrome c [Polyangiaceae bacterium]
MKVLKVIAVGVLALVLVALGGIFYFKAAAKQRLAKDYRVAAASIPIPYPLSPDEIEKLAPEQRAPAALQALAQERAVARGKHYVESRAACAECHGTDFGGKVIVDNPAMGRWIAPNITRGGVTKSYRAEDWDRIMRHGILPSGKPAVMPAADFAAFSDQEVSDIASYIHSLPPVARVMPKSELGPIYSFLIVSGKLPLSAETIEHGTSHAALPPTLAVSNELGKHLALTCMGCHGEGLSGGKIDAGDPAWPPARNITFDDTGLGKWSLEDFRKALKEGVRPDGTKLDPAMPVAYTARLQLEEVDALYLYLKSVPKKSYGNH